MRFKAFFTNNGNRLKICEGGSASLNSRFADSVQNTDVSMQKFNQFKLRFSDNMPDLISVKSVSDSVPSRLKQAEENGEKKVVFDLAASTDAKFLNSRDISFVIQKIFEHLQSQKSPQEVVLTVLRGSFDSVANIAQKVFALLNQNN
jgi:hypothetical protein